MFELLDVGVHGKGYYKKRDTQGFINKILYHFG